jgi:hypothetical protein
MRNDEFGDPCPIHHDFTASLSGSIAERTLPNYWGENALTKGVSYCEILSSPCAFQYLLESEDQASGTLYPHSLATEPPMEDTFSLTYALRDFTESAGSTPEFVTAIESNNTNSDHNRIPMDSHYPYDQPVLHCNRRGPRLPAADYEANIPRLQERLKREGANPDAVALIQKIFCSGVALDALTRRRTREEAAMEAFGKGAGPVYLAFLETVEPGKKDNGTRYRCRLCPNNGEDGTWKHHRDVLRHLRKEHFGLGDKCPRWYVDSHSIIFRALTVY